MKRTLPWLWLLVVAFVAVYAGIRLVSGVELQSDIFALLPRAEQDAVAQRIQDNIATSLSHRVIFLIGDADPAKALLASQYFAAALERSGQISALTSKIDPSAQRKMGAAFFPYRTGLLSTKDRALLKANDAQALVARAQTLLYGPGGFANGKLIASDPFFLLPNFFLNLPLPQSRLTLENGVLTVHDQGKTYVFVSATISGEPYATAFQERFIPLLDKISADVATRAPNASILRVGAVFYAAEATREATTETSVIGMISVAGTLALLFLVFRRLQPILMGLLAIAIGVLFAFTGTLVIFGQLHAVALLFGISLIGVSVDYSLQYFCEYFDAEAHNPTERFRRVMPSIAIGLFTTLIGYLTLLLAPFPGLRQVATFSVIGLIASVLTVLLWFPLLDRKSPALHSSRLVKLAARHWMFWECSDFRIARRVVVGVCLVLATIGAFLLRADDDVRHLQSLSPDLKRQEAQVQRLIGSSGGTQFMLVRGPDEQALLRTEEVLTDRLESAKRQGLLADFQAVSQFVPSIARQTENRRLVHERLMPYSASLLTPLGNVKPAAGTPPSGFLLLKDLPRTGPLALLNILDVTTAGHPAHVVLLSDVRKPESLRALTADVSGVRFIDLTGDWSQLFGTYRRYALALLVLSGLLMYPIHAWRYGWGNGLRVMVPSVGAATLTPLIAAVAGVNFTFFDAMALVLVLSIGVDYSIFCRETSGSRKSVTILAIALAALCTVLSFGLLALSRVFAVHAFGTTMLIGIILAFLFAPYAGNADRASRS